MTTPICRCRVMYLGSAVPHVTKDGLQGIQEPLRDLYPESGLCDRNSAGIDSWISVWSNGILVENVDDSGRDIKRFFPIESLHYCAAVRYVMIPSYNDGVNETLKTPGEKIAKFLPLDSPFLRDPEERHPPLFACILRRTTGIKVLECHAFICKREPAANALVRCCFHAYADSMYAKQLDENPYSQLGGRRSQSVSALESIDKSNLNGLEREDLRDNTPPVNGHSSKSPSDIGASSNISQSPDEENHKVWPNNEREREHHSRATKPRQIMIPTQMPPPPALPPPLISKEKIKEFSSLSKKKRKSKSNGSIMPIMYPGPHVNGFPVNLVSVPQVVPHPPSQPPHLPPHFFQQQMPHPIYGQGSNIFTMSRKPKRNPPFIQQELPVFMGPPPEEPIYIQTMRPLTPLSNFHPIPHPPSTLHHHPPHHLNDSQYVQFPIQTYGTTSRKEKIKHHKEMKNRREANGDGDSPVNTGIYRTKGHLNERAFSYSIRQEHRSRSNSLANIQFTNGEMDSKLIVDNHEQYSLEHRMQNGNGNGNGSEFNGHNGNMIKNGIKYHPTRNSCNDLLREKELSQSLSALNLKGDLKTQKIASIKRGKQNGSINKLTIAPVPAPPPMPPMVNGKAIANQNTQNGKRSKVNNNHGKQKK